MKQKVQGRDRLRLAGTACPEIGCKASDAMALVSWLKYKLGLEVDAWRRLLIQVLPPLIVNLVGQFLIADTMKLHWAYYKTADAFVHILKGGRILLSGSERRSAMQVQIRVRRFWD